MTHHTAAIYLRRSFAREANAGEVSHEKQEGLCRDLAARNGYDAPAVRVFLDWGKSGGAGKEHMRTGYLNLKKAIEGGEITDLFSYDQSRLTRSVKEWADLAALCADKGVRVHLVHGGTTDFSTATGKMTTTILAAINEFIRDLAVQHQRETRERKIASNERAIAEAIERGEEPPIDRWHGLGARRPYGDLPGEAEVVAGMVELYERTGSYSVVARDLNERGVPTRKATEARDLFARGAIGAETLAKREAIRWTAAAVRGILIPASSKSTRNLMGRADKVKPTVVQHRRGAALKSPHLLTALLRCPCGKTLTPQLIKATGGTKRTVYLCDSARNNPEHPRPYSTQEKDILPVVREQVVAFQRQFVLIDSAVEDAQRDIAALVARREEIGSLVADGVLTRDQGKVRQAKLDAVIARLRATAELATLPLVDWDDRPAANHALRVMIDHIGMEIVDGALRATDIDWRVSPPTVTSTGTPVVITVEPDEVA